MAAECVILLHGLARTSGSLATLADALAANGYTVANIDYPSRKDTIENLAGPAIEAGLERCATGDATAVNVVTHSMGGILLRYYLEQQSIAGLHRIVMLAPPNQGSKVVDAMRHIPAFALINGPAGLQLGTGPDSLPLQLGPVQAELGIIAGNRTINVVLSQFLDNPDDGKVSVASTRVAGMCSFIEMPVNHATMMNNKVVIGQVGEFLATGRFNGEGAENGLCGGSP